MLQAGCLYRELRIRMCALIGVLSPIYANEDQKERCMLARTEKATGLPIRTFGLLAVFLCFLAKPDVLRARSLPNLLESGQNDLIYVDSYDRQSLSDMAKTELEDPDTQTAGKPQTGASETPGQYRSLFKIKPEPETPRTAGPDVLALDIPVEISNRLVTICLHNRDAASSTKGFDTQKGKMPRFTSEPSQTTCMQVEPTRHTLVFWKENQEGSLEPVLSGRFDLRDAQGKYVLLRWERD